MKKSSQPTANKISSRKNDNFCFETTKYSKIADSLFINLTWNPRKIDSRGHLSPPRKLPPFGPPPLWSSVKGGGGGRERGYRYFLELHNLNFYSKSPLSFFANFKVEYIGPWETSTGGSLILKIVYGECSMRLRFPVTFHGIWVHGAKTLLPFSFSSKNKNIFIRFKIHSFIFLTFLRHIKRGNSSPPEV